MLEKIRIILVNTSHPGNIGSAARAMKTMGLKQLFLVSPKEFPHVKAYEMASSADDILEKARIVTSLPEALVGCSLAIGASARIRAFDLRHLDPRVCAEKIMEEVALSLESDASTSSPDSPDVALVFGREQSGLTNEELLRCQYHVGIPSNPDYSSLNLAAAVQVLCYEVRMAFLNRQTLDGKSAFLQREGEVSQRGGTGKAAFPKQIIEKATIDDIEQFYEHLQFILARLGFLKKENPTLMPKLRRIFNRIHLEKPEIHILRGILTAVQKGKNVDFST